MPVIVMDKLNRMEINDGIAFASLFNLWPGFKCGLNELWPSKKNMNRYFRAR